MSVGECAIMPVHILCIVGNICAYLTTVYVYMHSLSFAGEQNGGRWGGFGDGMITFLARSWWGGVGLDGMITFLGSAKDWQISRCGMLRRRCSSKYKQIQVLAAPALHRKPGIMSVLNALQLYTNDCSKGTIQIAPKDTFVPDSLTWLPRCLGKKKEFLELLVRLMFAFSLAGAMNCPRANDNNYPYIYICGRDLPVLYERIHICAVTPGSSVQKLIMGQATKSIQ